MRFCKHAFFFFFFFKVPPCNFVDSGSCPCDTRKCLTPIVARQKVVLIPLWEGREGSGEGHGRQWRRGCGCVGWVGWVVFCFFARGMSSSLGFCHSVTKDPPWNTRPLGLWQLNHEALSTADTNAEGTHSSRCTRRQKVMCSRCSQELHAVKSPVVCVDISAVMLLEMEDS